MNPAWKILLHVQGKLRLCILKIISGVFSKYIFHTQHTLITHVETNMWPEVANTNTAPIDSYLTIVAHKQISWFVKHRSQQKVVWKPVSASRFLQIFVVMSFSARSSTL